MADAYWDRFITAYREHVARLAADPEAAAARMKTHDQGAYVAPSVGARDVTVDYESGSFPVRVYGPGTTSASRPLLVWCHGGAWATGDLDSPEADATAREVCARANAVVVSVGYRLAANGMHFPVPHDDVVAAYQWAVDHAEGLGADPGRITLGGVSAGGNLAAGAALRVRDDGRPTPAALLLAYPCLHPELPPASAELQSKLDRCPPEVNFRPDEMQIVVENYLGAPIADASAYAMPGVAADLTGLPPTLIINCEYDALRASGERFAQQLQEAGVRVFVETARDVTHGHLDRPGPAEAAQSHADIASWVQTRTLPALSHRLELDPSA